MVNSNQARGEVLRAICEVPLPAMSAAISLVRTAGYGELADELTRLKEHWRDVVHAFAVQLEGPSEVEQQRAADRAREVERSRLFLLTAAMREESARTHAPVSADRFAELSRRVRSREVLDAG